MKRLLVLLFISILASGCGISNFDVKSGERDENIVNSEMAYVLACVSGDGETIWQHTDTHHADKWNNREMFDLVPQSGFSSAFIKKKYYFVQLKPGTYTMTHFVHSSSTTRTYMTDKGRERNEALKHNGGLLASFTVEKGKINYIGDFSLNAKFSTVTMDVKDDQKAALEYLRKKYPKINPAGLFTVKLIQKKQ